ncbi:FecR family protein [Butyricimonas synergistica]|uniref:FecR family protein n=1 Tax=Butyricimonas synergistica TaxID=544644 RepID=UPI0003615EA9|nr:FecR family protein [Butyricimonas synergistica]
MKRDLYKVIELFKKSLGNTLSDEERQEMDVLLQDASLRKAHEELLDEAFVTGKFKEFESYEYKPAFEALKKQVYRSRFRRWMAWGASVAAVLILGFMIRENLKLSTGGQVAVNREIVPPGETAAVLKLADGRTVVIGKEPVAIMENDGNVVKYENGQLSYTFVNTVKKELYNELKVPIGGECHVVLNDGTEVWLNAGSELKYPVAFMGKERKVELSGEGYFRVKKDSLPFIVGVESGDITVLGTSFGVTAYRGEIGYTTLVSGKVSFTSKNKESVILSPGEQVVVLLSGMVEVRTVDVEEFVGWKDGKFVFKNKSLGDIMHVLERWYGIKAVFKDENVKKVEYTGSLERYDNINTFLRLLEKLNDVHYEIKEDVIILYK